MERQKKNKIFKRRVIVSSIFLGVIFTLLIGCFVVLSRGITIDNFTIANVKLQGLYLKLDNKLVLSLDELTIKQKKQQSIDAPQAINWFQKSLVIISYFEKIQIKKINLSPSQSASIFYDGETYRLNFPAIQALFQIQQNSQKIQLNIKELILHKLKTQVNGCIDYSLTQSKIDFSLTAHALEEQINRSEKLIIKGNSDFKTINLSAFSTPIADLLVYEKEIKKIPALYDWLIKKSSFGEVRIKNLFFSAPLNENFTSKMLKSLYAELDLKNVSLKLTPDLDPITTPFLKVKFQKEVLNFELQKPRYDGIKLNGSSVELHNLTHPSLGVKTIVQLKSKNAPLDERIHKILRAYHIDFDIDQTDSALDLNLKLSFQKIDGKLNVEAQGIFKSQDATLDLFGMPLFAKTLNVALEINPSGRHIFISDSLARLQKPIIEGLINCSIDLDAKTIQGRLQPSLVQIQTSSNASSPLQQIFTLNQGDLNQISFNASYANSPSISIPDLRIKLDLGAEKHIIVEDINKLYPYSPLLQHLAIKNGALSIQTKDFANFIIAAELRELQYPIFDKEFNPITSLNASIQITPQKITATSLDQSITLSYESNILKAILKDKNFTFESLKNHQIPVLPFGNFSSSTIESAEEADSAEEVESTEEEAESSEEGAESTEREAEIVEEETESTEETEQVEEEETTPETQDETPDATSQEETQEEQNTPEIQPTTKPEKQKSDFKIYVESKNSAFKYKDFIIPTDEIIINSKDGKTTLDATHKNGVLNLDSYDDIIRFSANNFSGNFVNLVAGKEIVQGGLFSAKGIYKNQILRSTVEMQNTIFKNFATLQNIVALIDTIPSLIVFKKPGFSTQGYQVKQGRISFDLNDTHLGLKRIDLVGDSIDVAGGGVITLENQELNVSLTISTIKGLSDVLSKIPIVGYLLLGKEGKISTGLILTGTLKDPKSEVTIAQDILTAPFKIIERIFIPE